MDDTRDGKIEFDEFLVLMANYVGPQVTTRRGAGAPPPEPGTQAVRAGRRGRRTRRTFSRLSR